MIGRLLSTLAILAGLALPTASRADAAMQDLILAAQGAGACQRAMPDMRGTSEALKAVGFQTVESSGTFKAFSDKRRKVAVLLTVEPNGRRACIVAASKMTVAQARALIEPWLQVAKPKLQGDASRPFVMGWIGGTFKGGPVELLIGEPTNIITFRGAAIIARTPV